MSDMPDRMFAWEYDIFKSAWDVDPEESPAHAVEYVHIDLFTAMTAERDAAREAALREAAEICPKGTFNDSDEERVWDYARHLILALIDKGDTN